MKGKRITIEDLARMVANGFSRVDKRLDAIEDTMTGMATKVDLAELEEKIEKGFDRLDRQFGGHDRIIDRLQDDMRLVKTKLKLS